MVETRPAENCISPRTTSSARHVRRLKLEVLDMEREPYRYPEYLVRVVTGSRFEPSYHAGAIMKIDMRHVERWERQP